MAWNNHSGSTTRRLSQRIRLKTLPYQISHANFTNPHDTRFRSTVGNLKLYTETYPQPDGSLAEEGGGSEAEVETPGTFL